MPVIESKAVQDANVIDGDPYASGGGPSGVGWNNDGGGVYSFSSGTTKITIDNNGVIRLDNPSDGSVIEIQANGLIHLAKGSSSLDLDSAGVRIVGPAVQINGQLYSPTWVNEGSGVYSFSSGTTKITIANDGRIRLDNVDDGSVIEIQSNGLIHLAKGSSKIDLDATKVDINGPSVLIKGQEFVNGGAVGWTNEGGGVYSFSSGTTKITIASDGRIRLNNVDDGSVIEIQANGFIHLAQGLSLVDIDSTGVHINGTSVQIKGQEFVNVPYSAAYTSNYAHDCRNGTPVQIGMLTGDINIAAPLNPIVGMPLTFLFKQDATGSRNLTFDPIFHGVSTTFGAPNQFGSVTFDYAFGAWLRRPSTQVWFT